MDLTDFPTTVLEFEDRFPDEAACREFLWNAKWPRGFECDRCKGRRSSYVIERGLEECLACGRQSSLTAGTLFHGTRTDLRRWFRAILEFVSRKHGCNAQDIRRLIGVSEPTAWRWLHKIREAVARRPKSKLKGEVEVDETYVGGPMPGVFGRACGEKKIPVIGAVEVVDQACGRARLAPIDDVGAESLGTFIGYHVHEDAVVHTDGWRGYAGVGEFFDHRPEVIGDPRTASKKFPHVHRLFSLTKRWMLGTYHGSWSKEFAPAYCEEFEFRFNRRNSVKRPMLFARIIEAGLIGAASTFRKSRAGGQIAAAS